jgi:type I restriction enzyme S subunit
MNNEKDRNGFKMTEIGWLPEEWSVVTLSGIAKFKNGINFNRDQKGKAGILTLDVLNMYGESIFINTKNLYRINKKISDEYLLKDDDVLFVRSSLKREGVGWASLYKSINEPVTFCGFIIRARISDKRVFVPFITYFLRTENARSELIASSGKVAITNINQGMLGKIKIPLPPLSEQKKIAAVLSAVQEAREKTEAVIAAAKELKKSLMKYLFTYGPVPVTEADQVRLKETEIGVMPEEWEVKAIKDSLKAMQYGISLRGSSSGRYPILRMNNLIDGKIDFSDLQFVNLNKNIFDKFRLNDGDILFNRTNSYDLVGKTSLFNLKAEFVFASYLIRLIANENVHAGFLNYYLNWGNSQKRLKMLATRGVSQSNISATKLKSFLVAIPRFDIQKNIAEYIFSLDQKIESEQSKKQALDQLFKSLLQNLMTGKIRVNHLEL